MGRKLKRVPLDFKWEINMTWKGYVNPYRSQECKSCDGSGLNKATKKIHDDWYSFDKAEWIYPFGPDKKRYNNLAWSNHITDLEVKALVEGGRLMDFTHTWTKEGGWKKKEPEYIPTAEEVNKWNIGYGFGHDAINQAICVEARAKNLGVYGLCEICEGEGRIFQSEEIKKLSEEWESFEPPTGEGYQLWETTSEGSPMSPVFKTLDELCEWCEENASVFGSSKTTKEKWKQMLGDNIVIHQDGNKIFI